MICQSPCLSLCHPLYLLSNHIDLYCLFLIAPPRLRLLADETPAHPPPYTQTLFAVPLSCDGCVKSVSDALYGLGGITKVEGNLKDQLIAVEGSGTLHHHARPADIRSHAHVRTHVFAITNTSSLFSLPQRLHPRLSRRFKRPEEMPSCEAQDPQTVRRSLAPPLSSLAVSRSHPEQDYVETDTTAKK